MILRLLHSSNKRALQNKRLYRNRKGPRCTRPFRLRGVYFFLRPLLFFFDFRFVVRGPAARFLGRGPAARFFIRGPAARLLADFFFDFFLADFFVRGPFGPPLGPPFGP